MKCFGFDDFDMLIKSAEEAILTLLSIVLADISLCSLSLASARCGRRVSASSVKKSEISYFLILFVQKRSGSMRLSPKSSPHKRTLFFAESLK